MKNPLKSLNRHIKAKLQKRSEKILEKKKLEEELWKMINEYSLIKNGKSRLSKSKQRRVEKYIDDAIESGTIKAIL